MQGHVFQLGALALLRRWVSFQLYTWRQGRRGLAGWWVPPAHLPPQVEPTSPRPPTGSAVPAPEAPAPGPGLHPRSPGSWGVNDGRGRSNKPVHPLAHSSTPRPRLGEDSRAPPAEDDEQLEQQQGLLQVPLVELLGQHLQRVEWQQRRLCTCFLWPAGRGVTGVLRTPQAPLPPQSSSLTCAAPGTTVRWSSLRYPRRPSATAADSPGPSAGSGGKGGDSRGAVSGRPVNGGRTRPDRDWGQQCGCRKGMRGKSGRRKGGGRKASIGGRPYTLTTLPVSCFPVSCPHLCNPWGPRQARPRQGRSLSVYMPGVWPWPTLLLGQP